MAIALNNTQHARAVLRLGIPIAGGHLAGFAITMTDTIMLGWHSVEELAALVLAGSYWFVLFILGSGFGVALMPLVAEADANNDSVEVRRSTRMALWLSMIYATLVMPLVLMAEPIFLRLGQSPEIADLAAQYLWIAGASVYPALGILVLKSYLAALERTQFALWTTIFGVGLNILINYALIFGNWGAPELGLRGAAMASISVNIFMFVLMCLYSYLATSEYALFQRLWRPDWSGFRRVFQLGWPIGVTNLAEVSLFVAAAFLIGRIGTYELAAHGIAIYIASATFVVHLGISNAATIRAGQAFGRRDEAELRRGGLVAMGVSLLLVILTIIVFVLWRTELAGLFIDPDDPLRPQILAIAANLLLFAAAFQLADAGQVMVLGLLRGVQDTKVPLIIAVISYWAVGMSSAYLLGFRAGFGVQGVWIGLVLGLLAAWILLSIRFWGRSVKIAVA